MNNNKSLIRIILLMLLVAMVIAASGCAPISAGWQQIRKLLGDDTQQTDTIDTGSAETSTSGTDGTEESVDDTTTSTEAPEGEEFVRAARKLDPMLWEVGEELYYIDPDKGELRYRFDIDNDEVLAAEVSTIVGFSQERIFCLSIPMHDDKGRAVHDVVAIKRDGSDREVVLLQVNNATVIDDNWLLVSRFGSNEGNDIETANTDSAQTSVLSDHDRIKLFARNLKKDEEFLVFQDDGNIYPGMDHVDAAIGADFVHDNDGIRVEISYPGYSEYPYVRYLFFADGEIVQDSQTAPWQDNLSRFQFNDGMAELLQEIKVYDDLAIYEQRAGELTSLVYDHPDKTYDILRDSNQFVLDFFYHQGHVLAQVYDPEATAEEAQLKLIVYNPEDDTLTSLDNAYDSFYQYQDRLAGLRVEASGNETVNNIEGHFVVDLIDGEGQPYEQIFDQVLKTGTAYGEPKYSAWRAGRNLVIRYEQHIPDTGTITETRTEWIFLRLTGA